MQLDNYLDRNFTGNSTTYDQNMQPIVSNIMWLFGGEEYEVGFNDVHRHVLKVFEECLKEV